MVGVPHPIRGMLRNNSYDSKLMVGGRGNTAQFYIGPAATIRAQPGI